MPRHMTLIAARYAQGLADYNAGHGADHVINTANAIEQMHDQPDLSAEQHDEIGNSIPSYFAGFLTGLIDDIRSISASPNVTRRGTKA